MIESKHPAARIDDIVVAGGGIAGLALALAVRRAWAGAEIAICDPLLGREPAPRRRSLRAVAVAAGSRRFLEGLGVWGAVADRAQPMTGMAITDSRPDDAPRPVYLDFGGEAEPGEPFAHMVFADDLRRELLLACRFAGIRMLGAKIGGFRPSTGTLAVATAGEALRARLLVAADGGRSRLRELAGIRSVGWDYRQSGIVATIAHEIPHRGRATQHFLPAGPLAILPLRAEDGTERRFSLVWTEETTEAARLVALPGPSFLAALEDRIGYEFGALSLEDTPSAHPLRLMLPRGLVEGRFALLGDAARTIHPLAGQGLNLGLRDAAVMAEKVVDRLSLGLDPGDPGMLAAYERARRFDGAAMAGATDGLNRLFSNDSLPVRLIRDLGLGLVDRLPGLKRALIRDAAGLSGAVPKAFEGQYRGFESAFSAGFAPRPGER